MKQIRSHDLDKRLEALGCRLVRRDPERYATWNIIPTRRKCWLGLANLDVVESVAARLEEELRLEFQAWFETRTVGDGGLPEEMGHALVFLVGQKGLTEEGARAVIQQWYSPPVSTLVPQPRLL